MGDIIAMDYSDRPIVRPGQDLLGRADFSLALAKAIDGMNIASDGFVMAIHGEWGAGKSSVVELICRYLRHIEMARESQTGQVYDVEINPRTLDEIEALALVYERVQNYLITTREPGIDVSLVEYGRQLEEFRRRLGTDEEAGDAAAYWRLLRRTRCSQRTRIVRFSPWLIAGNAELSSALLSEVSRIMGDRPDVSAAFSGLLGRLAELGPLAAAGVDFATGGLGGSLLNAGATLSEKIADRMSQGPTLDDLRQNLHASLKGLSNQRLLVVVDDLDRLTPKETLSMLSLVKRLGDLPNTIYLLTYDQSRVNRNLRRLKIDDRYAEKIVQYSVSIPPPDTDAFFDLVTADLERIIGVIEPSVAGRLGEVWQNVLRPYIRTPRDVKRLSNALAVSIPALRDGTDLVDLILVEAIRVFDGSAYDVLRDEIANLVGL